MAPVVAVLTAVPWAYYATVDPTVGAATIAAIASVANALILRRHERHVDERFSERRVVVTRAEDGVTISDEERRELEDRRREAKKSARERRRRGRRKSDAS